MRTIPWDVFGWTAAIGLAAATFYVGGYLAIVEPLLEMENPVVAAFCQ